jgi:hypothetical protein
MSTAPTTRTTKKDKTTRERVDRLYRELVQEHRRANAAWRRIGEITIELCELGETFKQIETRLGANKSSLHRWAQIVRAFPTVDDSMLKGKLACMSVLNSCVSSAKQIAGNKTDRWIRVAQEALTLVAALDTIPSVRQLSALLAQRRQASIRRAEARLRSSWANSSDHSVHHSDCVYVADMLDDGALDMAWLDPCYLYPTNTETESESKLFARNPLVLRGCANGSAEETRLVLGRLISILSAKLKRTGVIVYWANGRSHDDPQIMSLFEKHSWCSTQASLWRKWKQGCGPAGRMYTADAPDGERYIVWARAGYVPLNRNHHLGRHGLIDDDSIRVDSVSDKFRFAQDGIIDGGGLKHAGRRHLMEKPVALAERFFEKYLAPNSLIFDAFGCSGSACIAALNLGHRFVYCELDRVNFEYGAARIGAHMQKIRGVRAKAVPPPPQPGWLGWPEGHEA